MNKFENLMGLKFNEYVVIGLSNRKDEDGNIWWICLCECGNIVELRSDNLKHGKGKQCGICAKENKLKPIYDRVKKGYLFTRLTIITVKNNTCICLCKCGNTIEVVTKHLLNGKVRSCGCIDHLKHDYTSTEKTKELNNLIFTSKNSDKKPKGKLTQEIVKVILNNYNDGFISVKYDVSNTSVQRVIRIYNYLTNYKFDKPKYFAKSLVDKVRIIIKEYENVSDDKEEIIEITFYHKIDAIVTDMIKNRMSCNLLSEKYSVNVENVENIKENIKIGKWKKYNESDSTPISCFFPVNVDDYIENAMFELGFIRNL